MKIAVIGTGYVGLVTGAAFSKFRHQVTCVDIDEKRLEGLRRGEVPFHEPGLPELVRSNVTLGNLRFTTSTAEAVAGARIVFIAVGTPSCEDGSADLQAVLAAARELGKTIEPGTVVVTKSTVPVGAADRVRAAIAEETTVPFHVASNPEFLKEGDALADFLKPPRVVIGADEPRAVEVLRELYRSILRTNDRILTMDIRSAELTKYAANAMLATRISFMNELARLADSVGADIEAVRLGIGSDPRIGPKFLFAGPGFGGSCFPKDLRALVHTGRSHDVQLTIADAAERANERHKRAFAQSIVGYFRGDVRDKRIAIWGLAFKPETDDIRESPALSLIEQLCAAGATVCAYDPAAMPNVRALLGDAIELVSEPYGAAEGADALVLVTEWRELRELDLPRLAELMRTRVLFDGRNVWPPADAARAGFVYHGVGRPLAARGRQLELGVM
jgi:UDPglucose 6-dehydrogenase